MGASTTSYMSGCIFSDVVAQFLVEKCCGEGCFSRKCGDGGEALWQLESEKFFTSDLR